MRVTRVDWLEGGLAVLEAAGSDALTIETLCRRLGVTKGSFYHHFESREEYLASLLRHWEESRTQQLIDLSDRAGSPAERLRLLTEHSMALPAAIEVAMRAWAKTDPQARSAQERVDARRMRYLEEQYSQVVGDVRLAHVMACTAYACFVGAQQIVPSLQGADLRAVMAQVGRLIAPYLAAEVEHGADA